MRIQLLLIVLFSFSFSNGMAIQKRKKKSSSTETMQASVTQKFNGFFAFEYEESKDKILLKVADLNKEFLYVNSLSEGIGSNDIGLDRGKLGGRRIVKFQKAGNKLLLIQPNYKYRASTDNELEKKSVQQAFAKSVLYGFPIVKEAKGGYWIDLTPFLKQDAFGVSRILKSKKQGTYKVDASRSALSLERTKAFPKNVEFEVLLTFSGTPQGRMLAGVAPNAAAVSVQQHHSFIELPDSNYEKRKFDPRAGVNALRYYDYATPVDQPTLQEWIVRHRLEKKDPTAPVSEAKEPIVYYLDDGTPEPVRSALLEGGRWWNQAFEAIGYKDAFQVKMLPENADPLDVRYNVIQWVHRSTRGWSYGSSVVDPRTGEIIKGHVSLGSLRIRQDYMIALGLTEAPFKEGVVKPDMLEMALARIRQLSAHEIGHTLGFAHNFAASTQNRASVMDYPHPTLQLEDGKISYKEAYDTGIGEWDITTVSYAYSDFPEGIDEKSALREIIEKSEKSGLAFMSDRDARPLGSAHPYAHLWDNGSSPVAELEKLLSIRNRALNQFGLDHLQEGETYSTLEDRMVPLYLLHRYQVEAVSKLIGGQLYEYAVKGRKIYTTSAVAKELQKEALAGFLNSLNPKQLLLPEKFRSLIPPRSFGNNRSRESFKSQTGVAFDHLSLAQTLANAQFSMLFHPERVNRLVQQKAFDESQLGLEDVMASVWKKVYATKARKHDEYIIQQILQDEVVNRLIQLHLSKIIYPQVRAEVQAFFNRILQDSQQSGTSPYAQYLAQKIKSYLADPTAYTQNTPPKIPDGSPIGSYQCYFSNE